MITKGITGPVNEQTMETINKANRRAENLLTIIDEMIDYAYMTTENESRYEKKRINLKEVIDHNIGLFTDMAKEKSIRLLSRCPAELVVWANRDLVNIILSNLITNAIKYSGGDTTVEVGAAAEDGRIHLTVRDEGMGMSPEELDSIFEEFYRSQRARRIERDGTGLGLPIVQRAVEALDGQISVYSVEGEGTTLHIYIAEYDPQTHGLQEAVETHAGEP
jgi:signal transduction histidine kinase